MNKHNDEKDKLEGYALDYFLNKHKPYWELVEKKEKPDFLLRSKETGKQFGIEVTHLWYDDEEARMLLGRSNKKVSDLQNADTLIKELNNRLVKKDTKARKYKFDKPMFLLIRITSRVFDKSTFDMYETDIVIPPDCIFKAIWLLFYNFDTQKWKDLKPLKISIGQEAGERENIPR